MIYVTGATGRLGLEVIKLLPEAVPLVRKKSNLKNEIITDFSSDQLKKILEDASVVIHLAASLDFTHPEKMWEANVELTRRIVEVVPENCRIVYASSISVYGKELAEVPANEKTECRPDTVYAKTKYEAEKIVLARENTTALRIGVIYGEQFEEYKTILKLLRKGWLPIIGDGKNYIPFVAVEDVALVIKNSIDATPGVYLVANGGLTQNEIMEIAANELGVRRPKGKIGLGLALFGAELEELRGKMLGVKPKFTKEHMLILGTNRIFDCSFAKKELDFKPKNLKQGIVEVIKNLDLAKKD